MKREDREFDGHRHPADSLLTFYSPSGLVLLSDFPGNLKNWFSNPKPHQSPFTFVCRSQSFWPLSPTLPCLVSFYIGLPVKAGLIFTLLLHPLQDYLGEKAPAPFTRHLRRPETDPFVPPLMSALPPRRQIAERSFQGSGT